MESQTPSSTTASDWPQRIRDWEQSGLSGAAFCKQHGLVYHQFAYWKRQVREPKAGDAQTQASRLVKVAQASGAEHGITIRLPGGMEIDGLDASNIGLLGRILEQL